MTIQSLIEQVDRKTSYAFSRQDVIQAINEGGKRVFNWIVKESPGKVFLKWDTSLSLLVGTQEYQLQPDVSQLTRIRELDPGTGKWRVIHSVIDITDLSSVETTQGNNSLVVGYADEDSKFKYYGPYEKDTGVFYIQIQPAIDMTRQLEIVYAAQYVELESEADYFMIPNDARGIVRDFAISELKEDDDDPSFVAREKRAMAKLTEYLTLVRDRTITDRPQQEGYLD